jgi:phage terminase large subunit
MNKTVEELKDNPVFFVEDVLRRKLWDRQKEILNAIHDHNRVAIRSGHGVGKTYTMAGAALWFLCTNKDSIVVTTAPTFRQVSEILWREIRQAYNGARFNLGGEVFTTKLEINDRWFAIGISSKDANRVQGFHAKKILILCDEAAGIDEKIYTGLEGLMSNEGAKMVLIGNPTSLAGTFYSSFRNPLWHTIHISSYDSPNVREGRMIIPGLVSKDWVDERAKEWGEESPLFFSKVMGQFPEQGSDTLIPLNKIEAAIDREVPNKGHTVIGVDVARYGTDKTVFILRHGHKVIGIEKYSSQSTVATSKRLEKFMNMYDDPVTRIDDIGIGGGVVDQLLDTYPNIIAINVGNAPMEVANEEKFKNLRAESYWHLRELFEQDRISIPDDGELISQLANLKYKYTPGGIQIESKDDMRKRGLSSPDCADALALCFIPYFDNQVQDKLLGQVDRPLTAGWQSRKW